MPGNRQLLRTVGGGVICEGRYVHLHGSHDVWWGVFFFLVMDLLFYFLKVKKSREEEKRGEVQ